MQRLIIWIIAAEVVVVHLYGLVHLVKVLFFRGCR
jgi:hypothetical protein